MRPYETRWIPCILPSWPTNIAEQVFQEVTPPAFQEVIMPT